MDVMKKFIVRYNDGDDMSTVWVTASNAQEAEARVKHEYWDCKSIISVELVK